VELLNFVGVIFIYVIQTTYMLLTVLNTLSRSSYVIYRLFIIMVSLFSMCLLELCMCSC